MKKLLLITTFLTGSLLFSLSCTAQIAKQYWSLNYDISASVTHCSDDNKGAIDLKVEGGVAPFTYEWSNGAQTEDIDRVEAGNYIVTVTDNTGRQICFMYTVDYILTEKTRIDVSSLMNIK